MLLFAKPACFIAGADIKELSGVKNIDKIRQLSIKGQEFCNRLENLPQPVVAAIHGSCLGGGLSELLACDYRIATESSVTLLGLPEVMLGLLPGAGGTQRLPKLIGLEKSLNMMLTGSFLRAKKALKLGLVDYIATESGLENVAIEAAHRLTTRTLKKVKKSHHFNLH